jgi:hypothetical protein
VSRQAELLEVVDALSASGGFAGGLHRGQQECDQDRNDRNHYKQLNQRERIASLHDVPQEMG